MLSHQFLDSVFAQVALIATWILQTIYFTDYHWTMAFLSTIGILLAISATNTFFAYQAVSKRIEQISNRPTSVWFLALQLIVYFARLALSNRYPQGGVIVAFLVLGSLPYSTVRLKKCYVFNHYRTLISNSLLYA